MTNTFFVVLPSNVSDYSDNKPNKFRSHLAKPIQFQGGNWVCGLYSIQYPQSWAATIGTDEKQWIEINYKTGTHFTIGIPKTTQLTPKSLSLFLKLALGMNNRSKKRRKREITTSDEDELVVEPEINLGSSPSKKQKLPRWLESIFDQHPHNYWDIIRDFEHEFEAHNNQIEEKQKEYDNETDTTKKEEIGADLEFLNSLSEDKKRKINQLKEEAEKRDEKDDRKTAKEFLERHPDDYHEELTRRKVDIINRYIELEQKIKEGKENGHTVRSAQQIQRFNNSIKRMRKNLEALESAIIEKDLKITREEFHQNNSKKHADYVNQFFDENPDDHWPKLKKKWNELQDLHVQIREKRHAYINEPDKDKKDEMQTKIEELRRLAIYRSNRFTAVQQAAYWKWKNLEINLAPTNAEVKQMQKIEEKTHPEYLELAKQGKEAEIPPPVITQEMIDVVNEREKYENEQKRIKDEREKEKQKVKDSLKEEHEKEKKEKEDSKVSLDLNASPPVISEEIIEEETKEEKEDEETKEEIFHIIEETEEKDNDITTDVEFEYVESLDRFRVLFHDSNIASINISPQLCYVLGFPFRPIVNGQIGKYGIDLKGGFTSFAVYSRGLTNSVIMGNSVSSLLRIVSIGNKTGGIVERIFDHPMFIPVLPREINEIEIELRWMNGSLIKFEHGSVIVTLMFNKVLRF